MTQGEPLKVLKILLFALDFLYQEMLTGVLRKMDRNCLVFANSNWEIILKAIRQQLDTAEEYRKAAGKCSKAILVSLQAILKGCWKATEKCQITSISK